MAHDYVMSRLEFLKFRLSNPKLNFSKSGAWRENGYGDTFGLAYTRAVNELRSSVRGKYSESYIAVFKIDLKTTAKYAFTRPRNVFLKARGYRIR